MRVELHPCFLLHQKPFRETSRLLEVYSKSHGRVGLVAKGVAGNRSGKRSILQAFVPLQIAWSGRGELYNLTAVEAEGSIYPLSGEKLFSGFYINELILRLLHRHDPHPELFSVYQTTLADLAGTACLETVLRQFEKELLNALGYGLIFDHDVVSGEPVQPDAMYDYLSGRGPVRIDSATVKAEGIKVRGKTLCLLSGAHPLMENENRIEAKRLMRYLLAPYLGEKPLQSRRIIESMKIKEVIK